MVWPHNWHCGHGRGERLRHFPSVYPHSHPYILYTYTHTHIHPYTHTPIHIYIHNCMDHSSKLTSVARPGNMLPTLGCNQSPIPPIASNNRAWSLPSVYLTSLLFLQHQSPTTKAATHQVGPGIPQSQGRGGTCRNFTPGRWRKSHTWLKSPASQKEKSYTLHRISTPVSLMESKQHWKIRSHPTLRTPWSNCYCTVETVYMSRPRCAQCSHIPAFHSYEGE